MSAAVNPIRILLVDDHPIVLHGLQQLFERHREFQVVGCCADGASVVEAVARYLPDILLLDLRMPGRSGLDVLRDLAGHYPGCRRISAGRHGARHEGVLTRCAAGVRARRLQRNTMH
jgi:two-component system nitrate/nitrite response regulator NarL